MILHNLVTEKQLKHPAVYAELIVNRRLKKRRARRRK